MEINTILNLIFVFLCIDFIISKLIIWKNLRDIGYLNSEFLALDRRLEKEVFKTLQKSDLK